MRRLITILAIAAMSIFDAGASAQTSNGTIAGSVVDSAGSGVAQAMVKVLGSHTGFQRSVETNSAGGFRLDSVLLDTYTVTAEAPGFARRSIADVLVNASVVTSVNPILAPGKVTETVQVRAASELIQTDSGELSATPGTEALENLPIPTLNPYMLSTTLPGVAAPPMEFQSVAGLQIQGAPGQPNGFQFSVNGTRPRSNNFLIEGQDNNDLGLHGQALVPENPEAYGDVTFLLNSYSAEFGHGGGSVSNLILKSGTNQFHGAVWDRLSNSSLDALDKGDLLNGAATKSKYRENVAGFSIGGPAWKDKLFFFASYQFDHYRATANINPVIVPTAAGLATLKALPTNSRLAAYLQAIGSLQGATGSPYTTSLALGLDPASGAPRGSVQVGPYRRNLKDMEDLSELDIKSDYVISANDTLQAHYIRSPDLTPYDTDLTALPGFDLESSGITHNAGIAETHLFSASLLNEFRFSYGRIGFSFAPRPDTYANPLGTAPTIGIGLTPEVTGFGAPEGYPQSRFHNTFQTQDTVGWTRGKHAVRVGFDLPVIQVRDQPGSDLYGSVLYGPAGSRYSALADYIDDFGGQGGLVAKSFGNPIARPVFYYQNYFAEDNWKFSPDLTLEIGFRYEYSGTPFNTMQYVGVTPASVGNYLSAVPERADTQDWGPRFGFAYAPMWMGEKKTVLRGGFGVFYDGLFTNIGDSILGSPPNTAYSTQLSTTSPSQKRGFSSFSTQLSALPTTAGPGDTAYYITPELVSPRILQWNLNIERELPFSFSGQIGYVGTRGEHLFAITDFNPYVNQVLGDSTRIFNTRGDVKRYDNTGDSIYHALQAQLVRKYRSGLSFRAAYTFSRMEDDTSELLTEGQFSANASVQYPSPRKQTDYGLSAFDHRQRLVFSYVYAIPKWSEIPRAVGEIVNGWQISGVSQFQSGNPANVEIGGNQDWNGDGITNDRPEVANPKAPLASYAIRGDDQAYWQTPTPPTPPGQYCDGPTAWYDNTCTVVPLSSVHWVLPYYGTRGNPVGRNNVILRGFEQWDISAQKGFNTWKDQSFDFRAEMFDAFNHGNTGTPNLDLIDGFNDPAGPSSPTAFGNYGPTVTGHRSIRMYLRYRF